MRGTYDTNKTLVESALAKAEYYEKQGNKELAEHFLQVAEKIEQVQKKNRERIAEKTKKNESRRL